jgi:hypothetical protein
MLKRLGQVQLKNELQRRTDDMQVVFIRKGTVILEHIIQITYQEVGQFH